MTSQQEAPSRDAPLVVVFDLGGVLVQLGGVEEMARLCGGLAEEALWRRWLGCRWVRAFERGRCGTEEFAAGVVADWDLPIGPDAFLTAFRDWPTGTQPGAAALVAEVRRVAVTVCLSNTNALHWDRQIARGFGLETMFDHTFLSYELGMVKPDPEIFEHVATTLGCEPGVLLLLDDNQLNVEAAREAGWAAERVRGVAEARRALERHGVLGAPPRQLRTGMHGPPR